MTKALLVLVLHLIGESERVHGASLKTKHRAQLGKPLQYWITFDTQLKISLSEQIRICNQPR